ncbi:hypothetical protein COLO4_11545 [Corchorus olitorius]|uniref:Uncharacterized protein n=1 Tax=Corchorus olitorius TaxID=93759 RepID=A0A1R3K435_9ROSI|nr:hypothetical protein COLO4_11545 [Corchorus olitorius]
MERERVERVTWKHALPVRGGATVWGGGSIGVAEKAEPNRGKKELARGGAAREFAAGVDPLQTFSSPKLDTPPFFMVLQDFRT